MKKPRNSTLMYRSAVAMQKDHAKLLKALFKAEDVIYCAGVPAGSENYFKLRKIIAAALKPHRKQIVQR